MVKHLLAMTKRFLGRPHAASDSTAGWNADAILAVLNKCCEADTFPVLDNGYVYLAATRLSLYKSANDWAMVIEVFGFSPRAGIPDTHIYTFGSTVVREKSATQFVSQKAYETYLENNPHNESRFVWPIEEGDWIDSEDGEVVSNGMHQVRVRNELFETPPAAAYADHGITLENPRHVEIFQLCRLLAAMRRDSVLATREERRMSLPPDMVQTMQLEEWHHPDVANGERPSSNQTFKTLAEVLASGDSSKYVPVEKPNTHWSHWPEAGTL